jgi:hypothetical protein
MEEQIKESEHPASHHAHSKGKAQEFVSFMVDHKVYALAAVIYLAIALVNFWPVVSHIATTVAGTGGDVYQFLWDIWFVGYSLFTLHQGIWHTSLLFWPVGASLVFQTSMPIASLLVSPFASVSLPLAFNIIFFTGFCLSGLAMFILAKYLTKNSYAAFVAGIIFAFSSFHIAQAYGHVEYANIEWIPLALYFFLRLLREDHHRYRKALALAVCMVLACFTIDVEVGISLTFLLIVVAVVYLIGKETRKRILNAGFWKAILVFIIATFILGAWAWIPIIGSIAHSGTGSLNSLSDIPHNALWSDDLLSFFIPNPYNGLLGGLFAGQSYIYHGDISETASYLTYTAIILALLGLWTHFKENRLWLGLAVLFFVLSLGPVLLVGSALTGSTVSGLPLPYQIYRLIPIFNTVREPGRFDLMLTIALAVMAAYGTKAIIEPKSENHLAHRIDMRALAIVFAVSVLLLVESNGLPLSAMAASAVTTHASIPKLYPQLSQVQGNFSVLPLPIIGTPSAPELYAGKAMYYQTESHKPIVGGYTSRENVTQQFSVYQIPIAVQATSLLNYGQLLYQSPIVENYTNQTLLTLYNYDTAFITLDKTAYNQSELNTLAAYLYSVFGNPVYNDNTTTVFSTQNAVARSLYKTYVSYPVLSDWNQTVSFVNGSYVQEWNPVGLGAISVFAPLPNQTDLYNTLYHNQVYRANSVISVAAASGVPQKLYIATPSSSGNYSVIGYENLTSAFTDYKLNVTMDLGPVGNTYFFIPQYTNYPVKILNISFSNGG